MFSVLNVNIDFQSENRFDITIKPQVQKSLPGKKLHCNCGVQYYEPLCFSLDKGVFKISFSGEHKTNSPLNLTIQPPYTQVGIILKEALTKVVKYDKSISHSFLAALNSVSRYHGIPSQGFGCKSSTSATNS